MKVIIWLTILFNLLLADTFVTLEDLENYPLKSNQVLLIDNRTRRAIGIIEITQKGEIKRLPLPASLKSKQKYSKINSTQPSQPVEYSQSSDSLKNKDEPLIYKNKQWNKKKIPFSIQEETILNQ
ncbi:hypothetical protein [Helicobacter sp. 11S03491-1]|uniref:hypothetical protein n=1 Tax=Helicobacter sp. 11S03491-1 TaxID=1476196 RepID=UPI000BA7DCEA|nr:hypothetical protein [Helicobacter sp. 11S03491-1]PAF41869.1 hypothetical protein BKH45_06050 [Helicobacter sp. 11S03491-1]